MTGINKVILVGHVGKDPDVRYLEGGVAIAKFPFATDESYTNKEGKKIVGVEWHNIVMWRGLAEIAEKWVKKGKMLYLEGRIKTKQYGEENNRKWFTEIVVENMIMLGGPRVDENGVKTAEHEEVAVGTPPAGTDDLPF